jgi:hypothetical protein
MASTGKKKTTMAKLNRESKLRERRLDKKSRKDARKLMLANPQEEPGELLGDEQEESTEQDPREAVLATLADA